MSAFGPFEAGREVAVVLMTKRTSGPIYLLVIASLMVAAVALALTADRALSAEMPKDFQGTWCTSGNTLKDDWGAYNTEGADCEGDYRSVEITATEVKSPALSVSCVIRKVTKFDVCPWGMIFRNRQRARIVRPFQINPWSPGFHVVLQCTGSSERPETIETRAAGDDRNRLGDRKGKNPSGNAARISVPLG
jgi:hypothetical protein